MAMFSAGQLAKFAGQKRITQETFDAAVRENIEEFDMEPEEALQSAVEEFTAQGVDLSNVIKTVTGGDISSHPTTAAVQALQAAAAAPDPDALAAAADELASLAGSDFSGDAAAVLHKAGAAAALIDSLPVAAAALLRVLNAVSALLAGTNRELQADFVAAKGAAALQQVLSQEPGSSAVTAAALQAAANSGVKSEAGKAALMEAGIGGATLEALRRYGDQPEAVQAACAVLCTLTNPDDDSQPASRAFPNARALAKDGAATQLVACLKSHPGQPPEVTAALATALKQVAANDEICQEVAAAGGVQLVLQILRAGLSDASLARPLCSLLRQLVSSDGNKALFVEHGGLELVAALLSSQRGSPAVQEQALGLLTNVTLRNPEAADKASECGCLDAVLELMRVGVSGAAGGKENRAATAVQRQACMAIRNMAVRNADVRAVLLDRGAEGLLRKVRAAYPSCAEAGSAALRDLGLDNYN